MNKQKRMIYIYEENVDFYNSLENKSEFINRKLSEEQHPDQKQMTSGERAGLDNMNFVKRKLAEIEAKRRGA